MLHNITHGSDCVLQYLAITHISINIALMNTPPKMVIYVFCENASAFFSKQFTSKNTAIWITAQTYVPPYAFTNSSILWTQINVL